MDGIRRSDVAGLDALTLEINSRDQSPHDRGVVHHNRRYWTIPFSKRVILVVAYQPLVPDPNCSLELEKTINEILLLLAAEQAAEAKARPAGRARP